MAEPTDTYVQQLAGELVTTQPTALRGTTPRHDDALRRAEDELAQLRRQLALVTTFIHNTPGHHKARTALAKHLGLPTPTKNGDR